MNKSEIKPLVSVIIPVYNGERFISDAVDNVLGQNYPSVELIIVDDGSTDKTGEIVKQFPADIRYLRQENAGPASARNRGIRNASGEFLTFLDVDDLWPENNLNLLTNEMFQEPDTEIIHGYAQLMEYNSATCGYDYSRNPKKSYPYFIGAAIYRRSVFDKVGLFDSTLLFSEGTDWFMRAVQLKVKFKRLDNITLLVRKHGQNMTHRKTLIELNMLRVLKKSIERKRAEAAGTRDSE
jgi:glycosyltransferase involved in cell wall biosynthesis